MPPADELLLAERLISYDSSRPEGVRDAVGFVCGWLQASGIAHRELEINGLPAVVASAGQGPRTVIWSSHVDVVPGRVEQFTAIRSDGRLYGRGAYDMKGALAAMLSALADLAREPETFPGLRVELLIAPDEEAEADSLDAKVTARLADEGHLGEFAICGEPTDLHIGVQAKGALVLRVEVEGRSAHGSTPWLGENAVLKAVDMFRRIGDLPFVHERSELFDGPSVNLGRIAGGDAVNRVPDRCVIHVDVRYLPTQDPAEVIRQVSSLGARVSAHYHVPAAQLDPHCAHVAALRHAVRAHHPGPALGVGRNGASDASVFLARGVPAVEFGPVGAGHHGPDEHVLIDSLAVYRRVLREFVTGLSQIGAG
jgi:succinyl-diaminopimelate desuccinylase